MAVGATAFYGFDETPTPDEDAIEAEDETEDTEGLTDILNSGDEDLFPGGVSVAATPDPVASVGTSQADYIGGGSGDDTLQGLQGDDLLYGGEGADVMSGDDGADTLHGEDGDDLLSGGAGDDEIFGHNGDDTLDGGPGADSLVGSAGNDMIAGGAGNDALHGDLDSDTLQGGEGQDTLFGGWGDDVIDGRDDAELDYLNGGGGDDFILAGGGDIVTTGEGADSIALGDWLSAEHQAKIIDFSVEEDRLMIVYDDLSGEEPDVSLERDEDDPSLQHVLMNGVRIAMVENTEELTLSHIVMIGESALPV